MATATAIVTLDALMSEIKSLRKDVRKIKAFFEDPTGEKSKARATNNGFNKPLEVSEKLRSFLNLPAGEMISRSQVTRKINEYVTEKSLKAGQLITLDETLKELLQPPADVQITFLNIQKYINPHYIKPPVAEKEPKTPKKEPAPKKDPEAPSAPKKPTVKKPAVATKA
jgi:upstream activation factor subunit UAF30